MQNINMNHKMNDLQVVTDRIISSKVSKSSNSFKEREHLEIDISWKTFFRILAIVFGLFVLSKITEVLFVVFIAFVITSSVLPFINFLQTKKISKFWAMVITYIIASVIILGSISLIFIPFIQETQVFAEKIPAIWQDLVNFVSNIKIPGIGLEGSYIVAELSKQFNFESGQVSTIWENSLGSAVSVLQSLSNVANVVLLILTSFVISIYMVAEHDDLIEIFLLRIVDVRKQRRVKKLIEDVESKLGRWLLGQATLCFIIGFMTWILLVALGIPFAVPLAIMAALLEAVPNIGPIITAIPLILIALILSGPTQAFLVLIGCIFIQQFENNIFVPRIMGSAVGVKPLFIIIGILIGFSLGGIIGSMLAVPTIVLIELGYNFYLDIERIKAEK